jgi:rod shape-determining protein MreC
MRTVPFLQLFIYLLLISIIIFGFDTINILKFPKLAVSFITTPIQFGVYRTSQIIDNQFYFVVASRFAAQENRAKDEQIGQLISENANLVRKLEETQNMLLQQQSLDPRTYNLIPARPVGRERYLRIDKGMSDGVAANQTVIFKDNYIGKVIDVSEKSANVLLPIDPDSRLSVFSFGKEGKAKGILSGSFGSEMKIEKILHDEKIVEGDLVYSEGTEGNLPRGLILGRVTDVKDQETQLFKEATVKPIFDNKDLVLVFVIKE